MGILRRMIKIALQPAINQHKGKIGEKKVDKVLNPNFFGKFYHRQINNLILLDDRGKSHQIDHIVIAKNGIFCIETKNFAGYILGTETQEKWIQCLNNQKFSFLNPLKQNRSHIYHLNQYLKNSYKIHSVIVMVQNNADSIACSNVVNLDDLKKYIETFEDSITYTEEEIDRIYNAILQLESQLSNREHVKKIRQTSKELKEGICPRCGEVLVKKNGKYGEFYGCSNFPRCKFTLKL